MATVQPYFTPTPVRTGAGSAFLDSWNSFVNIRTKMNIAAMERQMQMYGPEALDAEIKRAQENVQLYMEVREQMLKSDQKFKSDMLKRLLPSSSGGGGGFDVDKQIQKQRFLLGMEATGNRAEFEKFTDKTQRFVAAMIGQGGGKPTGVGITIEKEMRGVNPDSTESVVVQTNRLLDAVSKEVYKKNKIDGDEKAHLAAMLADFLEGDLSESFTKKYADSPRETNRKIDLVIEQLLNIHNTAMNQEQETGKDAADWWKVNFLSGVRPVDQTRLTKLEEDRKRLQREDLTDTERRQLEAEVSATEQLLSLYDQASAGSGRRSPAPRLTEQQVEMLTQPLDTKDIDARIAAAEGRLSSAELRKRLAMRGADPSDMFRPFTRNYLLETPFTYETDEGRTAREMTAELRDKRLVPGEKSVFYEFIEQNKPYAVPNAPGLVVGVTPENKPFYLYEDEYKEVDETDADYLSVVEILKNIDEQMKMEEAAKPIPL
jgi:hypothetical protein